MSVTELLPAAQLERTVAPASRLVSRAMSTGLPDIRAGQLWLIELAMNSEPSPALRRILADANVVIYDRSLTDIVASCLPMGGYAEPAARADESGDPAAARAVRFAADGWSVVRLVPARPTQRERLVRVRRLVEETAPHRAASEVAVTVHGDINGPVSEPTETTLSRLDLAVVTYPRETRLTIAIDLASSGGGIARLHAVAGNGLAG
jgi:hypothetical protein